MDEHFGLNLLSLNDSVTSSASAAQELYSNSNLNSASSLSWADDVSYCLLQSALATAKI